MKTPFIKIFLLLSASAAALATAFVSKPEWVGGFVAGQMVFAGSVLVLTGIGERMLERGEKIAGWVMPVLMLGRLVLLSIGGYVFLIGLGLSPIAFVAGALASLVLVTVAIVAQHRFGSTRA